MNFLPPSENRRTKIQEKYRKARKRQLATLVLAVTGLALLVLVVFVAGISLRSCSQTKGVISRDTYGRTNDPSRLVAAVLSQDVKPVAWLAAVAGENLYLAQDESRGTAVYPNLPVDTLSAVQVDSGEAVWESPLDGQAMGLIAGNSSVVVFRQVLSEPPRLAITARDAATGADAWSQEISTSEPGSIVQCGKALVVGYWQPDGYRLVGYNMATGAKAWGRKLEIPLASVGLDMGVGLPGITLHEAGEDIVYQVANSIGVVSAGKGKVYRTYTCPDMITQVAVDAPAKKLILLTAAESENEFSLKWMPFYDGVPVQIESLAIKDGQIDLLAQGGYCAVCYIQPPGAGIGQTVIKGYKPGEPEPLVELFLPCGIPGGICTLGQATAGDFLVAVNQRLGDTDLPSGWSEIYNVSCKEPAIQKVLRQSVPVLGLAAFKSDAIVMNKGGGIFQYAGDAGKLVRIEIAKFPLLNWYTDQQRSSLVVASYDHGYAAGNPAGNLQVIVLR